MTITITRYHDISCGHRVVGHEGKCRHLHGHNYRIHFTCEAEGLDDIGRVIDFSVVKEKLCMWLEEYWDHKFLAWEQDFALQDIYFNIAGRVEFTSAQTFQQSIIFVPFNPTAENMAQHLVDVIGPLQLKGTGVTLTSVKIEETAKCHATYTKDAK